VPATFARLLARQLEKAADEQGAARYQRPDTLFTLVGLAGSGTMSSELRAKTFSEIRVRATPVIAEQDLRQALASIQSAMSGAPVFDEVTSFDSAVASEAKQSALVAIIASLLAIIGYVWLRFENLVYGLAAVVALTHDVLVTLGCVALASMLADTPVGSLLLLTDFRINMAMIAAFLTIVGYSLNDTIVIFDRLRELRGKNPNVTKELINLTVNQTLSRTILTALTVFVTVVILYALGGEGIHGFAFCMVVGAVSGTYSTVYIASPLVLAFVKLASKPNVKTTASAKPAAV
jgi:SecD/SecF fusion protein